MTRGYLYYAPAGISLGPSRNSGRVSVHWSAVLPQHSFVSRSTTPRVQRMLLRQLEPHVRYRPNRELSSRRALQTTVRWQATRRPGSAARSILGALAHASASWPTRRLHISPQSTPTRAQGTSACVQRAGSHLIGRIGTCRMIHPIPASAPHPLPCPKLIAGRNPPARLPAPSQIRSPRLQRLCAARRQRAVYPAFKNRSRLRPLSRLRRRPASPALPATEFSSGSLPARFPPRLPSSAQIIPGWQNPPPARTASPLSEARGRPRPLNDARERDALP
jgi:hypothetical protein